MKLEIKLDDYGVTGIVAEADIKLSPADFIARYFEPAVHVLLNYHAFKASAAVEGVIQSTAAVEAPVVQSAQMGFEQALSQMKLGRKLARVGWKDRWLAVDPVLLPHIADVTVPRDKDGTALSVSISGYTHAKDDMNARDWVVIP